MAIPPIAALEIGTSRTVVCVGESNGRVRSPARVLSHDRCAKGQIFDDAGAHGC